MNNKGHGSRGAVERSIGVTLLSAVAKGWVRCSRETGRSWVVRTFLHPRHGLRGSFLLSVRFAALLALSQLHGPGSMFVSRDVGFVSRDAGFVTDA